MRNVVNLGTGKVRLKFRKCTNPTLAKPALYSLSPFLCFSWQDRSSIALEEPKGKVHRLFLTPSLQTVLFQMKTNPVFFSPHGGTSLYHNLSFLSQTLFFWNHWQNWLRWEQEVPTSTLPSEFGFGVVKSFSIPGLISRLIKSILCHFPTNFVCIERINMYFPIEVEVCNHPIYF